MSTNMNPTCRIDGFHPVEKRWDSDYCGNESYALDLCRMYVRDMLADPNWMGWQFRIIDCEAGAEYPLEPSQEWTNAYERGLTAAHEAGAIDVREYARAYAQRETD